MTMSLST